MKNTSIGIFILCIIFVNALIAQEITVQPQKPSPGDKIQIVFTPGEDNKDVNPQIHIYRGSEREAVDLDLKSTDRGLEGTYIIPIDATLAFVTVMSEDFREPVSNGILVKPQEDGKPIPGSEISLMNIYTLGFRMGLEQDLEKAEHYWKNADPDDRIKEYGTYGYMLRKKYPEEYKEKLIAEAQDILSNNPTTEEEFIAAHHYARTAEDSVMQEKVKEHAEVKFKNGVLTASAISAAATKTKDIEEKAALYQELEEMIKVNPELPGNETFKRSFDYLSYLLATHHLTEGEMEEAEKYLNATSPTRKMNAMNAAAWKWAGDGDFDKPPTDLKSAKKYSAKTIAWVENEMVNMEDKYVGSSKKQYTNTLNRFYKHPYFNTYAFILYKDGQYEKAWKIQNEISRKTNYDNSETNERLIKYMKKVKSSEEVEEKLSELIAEGNFTSGMKDMLKELFISNNNAEGMFEKYFSLLEEQSHENLKEELLKEKLSDPAPQFTLANLNGDSVSLSDLKGKTVIVDFWATWCGPCKRSFPGMQKAVEKFSDNDDVVFLFIDTWERGDNKEENAAEFMEEHNYPFTVLMDNNNKVVTEYKVEGIPTKFVIDGDGNIIFKSVGFGGDESKLVRELEVMIEEAVATSAVHKT